MDERIISSETVDAEEVSFETSLRPQNLSQYIGQDKVKNNLTVFIEVTHSEMKHWIMCFYMALQDLVKQRLRWSLHQKWVAKLKQRVDQLLNVQATWRQF